MRAAFFDVDGTLASSNVVSCYAHAQMHAKSRGWRMLWVLLFLPKVPFYMLVDCIDRSMFSRHFFGNYRSIVPWQLERWIQDAGDSYWRRHLQPRALRRIEWHREQGDRIVLASGGVEQSLVPLMHLVSPDYVVCAHLERQEGRFTGHLEAGPIVGQAKADAVHRLAAEADIDLAECYAYGDSFSDREFLQSVGHPTAVNPDRALRRLAEEQDWAVLDWRGNRSERR